VAEFFTTTEEGEDSSADSAEAAPAAPLDGAREAGGGVRAESVPLPPMPRASFVRFNAAGLQSLCCEASVLGYALWAAENDALALVGEGARPLLMPPPET